MTAKAISPADPVTIGRVPVHPIRLRDLLEFLTVAAAGHAKAAVFYANAHAVNLADSDPHFREALRSASVVFCDGKGVQWASRLLGESIPERFTPPDWISELCRIAVDNRFRLFFLGAKEGIAEAAAEQLRAEFPALQIRSLHGYLGDESNDQAISAINRFRPHFLLVGMGMPKQELWIHEHLNRLDIRVAIAVGGMFDYTSKSAWRAPRWITNRGLEWFTRLLREPRRLGRRYLVGNPRFVWRVTRQALRGRRS